MRGIVKVGITGLDNMLYGGIPENNQVILAGGPGSGKTLLGFEYLYRNAKMGHTSIFFTLDEDPDKVLENAKQAFVNLKDIDELVKSKKLILEGEDPSEALLTSRDSVDYEFGKLVSNIESVVTSESATRIVIDSSSILEILVKDPLAYRRSMLSMATNFRRLGVTSMLTSELSVPERSGLKFSPEYFLFDGIIVLYQTGQETRRVLGLEVIKMRGSRHSFVTAPYDITADGFKVFTAEDVSEYVQ